MTSITLICLMPCSILFSHNDEILQKLAPQGTKANPWHIHTGKGYRINEVKHPSTGKVILRSLDGCRLSEVDPDCKEKVYYLPETAIEKLLDLSTEPKYQDMFIDGILLTSSLYWAIKSPSTSSTNPGIVSRCFKTFLRKTFFKIPVINKIKFNHQRLRPIASKVSRITAGGFAIYFAYDMLKTKQDINVVLERMKQEKLYLSRCQHLSRSFFADMRALGIYLPLEDEWATYIDGHHYLESIKTEQQLADDILMQARNQGIDDKCKAYQHFQEHIESVDCRTVPSLDLTPVDLMCLQKDKEQEMIEEVLLFQ